MTKVTYLIPTLFGLEGVAAQECRRLGLENVKGEDGRVLCEGDIAQLPRLNLNLRTGERVIVMLGRFPADSFDALFEGTAALPWEEFIPRDGKFPVRCQSVGSQLHAEVTCGNVVKKAVAKRLGGKYGLTTLPETGAEFSVRCLILKDVVTLGIDTSGPSLHKRGYRALNTGAPLRETLAAAMVLLSRYHGKGILADPFCGSGTIPIEAAMIAKNRAPGLERTFPSQKWPLVPQQAWMDGADEAMDGEYHGTYQIFGSDIDPKAVALAKENAALAGVDDLVTFDLADATKFASEAPAGRIVTNPPYGQRLMEKDEAERLYAAFGKAFRRLPKGWELYLLSSHTEFERTFGKPAQKRRKLYNGPLLCNLFQYK